MGAIYRRELCAYFISPIGYVFVGVFLMLSGAFFALSTLFSATTSLSAYFTYVLLSFVVLIPLLTMRQFSEERKTKTEQLLLTSPVSLWGMVAAKFFAAFTLFGVTLLLSCINFLFIRPEHGTVNVPVMFAQLVGVLLCGAAFCALGLFLSSLTENQLIAAITSIGAIVAMLGLGFVTPDISNTVLRSTLKWFSIFDRFYTFSYGLFDFTSLFYYTSIAFVFLFLTVRVLEKRRWG